MRANAWFLSPIGSPYRSVRLVLYCAIAVSCLFTVGCGLSKAQQQQAVATVTPWLEMIDTEKYDEGWRRTGEYFKGTIASERWNELMRAYRRPLGRMLSRSLTSAKREKSLPGVPDANYVVIKFNTVFEKKKEAVETVITIVDQSGQLSVVGYYVE